MSSPNPPERLAEDRAQSRPVASWVWIAVFGGLLATYCAGIALGGPWDPWETHYGEVARNIIARNDPIDLWWKPGQGPDGSKETTFWSKHAGPFWAMAAGLWALGVGDGDDRHEMVGGPWPELAIRLPSVLVTFAMLAIVAVTLRRLRGDRAALLSVIAVATMGQLAMIGRQALTDIYFIAPLSLSICAWAMSFEQADRPLITRGRGWTRRPHDRAYWAFLATYAIAVLLPIGVMLAHVLSPGTFARVARFRPGGSNPPVSVLTTMAWVLAGYAALATVVLWASSRWTLRSQAWLGIFYLGAGLALMGKGILGPGIVGAFVLVHTLVTGRWDRVARAVPLLGALIFIVACVPWHHAMGLFRGAGWFRELLLVHNVARFSAGEQSQAIGGADFYLVTLGLAAFPWIAVAPAALGWTFDRLGDPQDARRGVLVWVTTWLLLTVAVITAATTKYHHYLTPCLVPLGVAIGLWMDDVWDRRRTRAVDADIVASSRLPLRLSAALLGAVVLGMVIRQVLAEPAWLVHLTTYLYTGMWRRGIEPPWILIGFALPCVLGLLAWTFDLGRASVGAMLLSAWLTCAWLLTVFMPTASHGWSQREAFERIAADWKRGDQIVSWSFYHRGETWFSKSRVWVTLEPRREALDRFIDEHRGRGQRLWILTTSAHAQRAPSQFPRDVAESFEERWTNGHYTLILAEVP